MAFQILVRLYIGILGSWLMSSSTLMLFAALAAMVKLGSSSISAAFFAVLLIFLGVVLSSAIMLSICFA